MLKLVSDLTNTQLDWAVCVANGHKREITIMRNDDRSLFPYPIWLRGKFVQKPTTNWGQSGPLIQSKKINLEFLDNGLCRAYQKPEDNFVSNSPLRAAMLCYVTNTLGSEIDIPDVLT